MKKFRCCRRRLEAVAQTCTDRPAVEFLDRGSSFLALAVTGEGVEQCSLADRIFIGRSNRVHAVVTRTFFDLAEAVVALKFGRAADTFTVVMAGVRIGLAVLQIFGFFSNGCIALMAG